MSEPILLFELLLVRHGQSTGNAGVPGESARDRQDPELSDEGCRQAQLLAQRFRRCPLDALFSSGLLRAVHTACAVASMQPENGAKTVEVLPLLTECNTLEDYTGQPMETIRSFYPMARFAPGWTQTQTVLPNDERSDEAYNIDRARHALAYLRDRFRNGERVMVVAHGIFNTVFLMQALQIPVQRFDPDFDNAGVTRLLFYKTGTGPWGFDVRLCSLNDLSHLYDTFPQTRYELQGEISHDCSSVS